MKKKELNYSVMFIASPDGGYVAYVPALPGLVTQGETIQEAQEMAKDAIEGYLAVLTEDGEEIPVESDDTVILKIQAVAP